MQLIILRSVMPFEMLGTRNRQPAYCEFESSSGCYLFLRFFGRIQWAVSSRCRRWTSCAYLKPLFIDLTRSTVVKRRIKPDPASVRTVVALPDEGHTAYASTLPTIGNHHNRRPEDARLSDYATATQPSRSCRISSTSPCHHHASLHAISLWPRMRACQALTPPFPASWRLRDDPSKDSGTRKRGRGRLEGQRPDFPHSPSYPRRGDAKFKIVM